MRWRTVDGETVVDEKQGLVDRRIEIRKPRQSVCQPPSADDI